ncbi:hypothetical protein [Halomonas sp. NCCP-2165]|nr:hypothetical protein [Halomonas sp. NCCP-2165]GKW50439.1 hypothetical protein NCCP2165_26540 [Halomonas sp. NCCP-2165]
MAASMLANEKFDIYDRIVSSLDAGVQLTYSPLIREAFHFCLQEAKRSADQPEVRKPRLSGVAPDAFPEKRKISKVGYFYDEGFLGNVLKEFEGKGVSVVKLELMEPKMKKVLSNKQEEEIGFFDSSLLNMCGLNIRDYLVGRFCFFNGMVSRYYESLARAGVDAVIFRVYYGLNYFPIILACKMLGITVIDVQHGINGFKHLAYSRFREGEVSSPLLPDIFWTWSAMATRMLEKDSFINAFSHIVEGGNPVFSGSGDSGDGAFLRGREGNRLRILYTHQPKSKAIPVPYDEIRELYNIKESKVVIRPHPLHFDEAMGIQRELKKLGVKSKVEDSRKVAINDSLSRTSVHVTYSSTCALDALNFGIPSVYCSDYIGDVEKEFSTGLLFRIGEIDESDLVRVPEKAVDYSLGGAEKVKKGVSRVLALTSSGRDGGDSI